MKHALNEYNSMLSSVESPAYLLSESALRKNCEVLSTLSKETGAKIVLAQKALAQPELYPILGEYLAGACASGPWEARLAKEFFPDQAHILTCAPAYSDQDIEELLPISNHLDFNSLSQWLRFKDRCLTHQAENPEQDLKFGLRINPEASTTDNPLYDPCAPGSRLGITADELSKASEQDLEGLEGLHFHTLCEQNASDLETTLQLVEAKFGYLLQRPTFKYLNLGGGHWITKPFYNLNKLKQLIQHLQETYQVEVWLEPGEAVAIHSGVLMASVLDISDNNEVSNVLLDISATAHMPDVLEMPYRPDVFDIKGNSTQTASQDRPSYRLGGNTCLASDVIGDYSFNTPLSIGDKIIFDDMAHYTMVKTSFFNGVKHPNIILIKEDGSIETLRQFDYADYLFFKKN